MKKFTKYPQSYVKASESSSNLRSFVGTDEWVHVMFSSEYDAWIQVLSITDGICKYRWLEYTDPRAKGKSGFYGDEWYGYDTFTDDVSKIKVISPVKSVKTSDLLSTFGRKIFW